MKNTITPAAQQHLRGQAGNAVITRCMTDALEGRWGSVTPHEAAQNNVAMSTHTTATGAYELSAAFGDAVVIVDRLNAGGPVEQVVVRFVGERSPA